VPTYTLCDDDPASLRAFVAILGRRDPKTVAAYLSTLRDLVAWLTTQLDGSLKNDAVPGKESYDQ
jgi:hypothetical protein